MAQGRLWVTGGGGFLGRHVVAEATDAGFEVVAPSSAEVDLRSPESRTAIARSRPTAIIHTAYRKDEPASIVDATRHVAEAAEHCDARLVHVSTDALFAGRPDPYLESDAPTPVHDYGRHKAEAEHIVATTRPSSVVARTSLIYGVDRPSVHDAAVRAAIDGSHPMTFFTDEYRSAVLAPDLAAALLHLAQDRDRVGVVNLGGPDTLSRAELARLSARRFGWDAGLLRTSTIGESGLVRPARVVLDSSNATRSGLTLRGPNQWWDEGVTRRS